MTINKAMLAALKALSYSEVDIKKTYKIQRQVKNLKPKKVDKKLFEIWDRKVLNEDYEVPVRIFYPKNVKVEGLLLFFHGGGWVVGNIDSYTKVCANMARLTKHMVVSVDYRLAPEHKFPCGLEDCYAVAKEIYLNSNFDDIKFKNISIIGDSAGGNLAAALSLLARDRGEFMPEKQILIYPATGNDYTENSKFESIRENGKDYLLTSSRINGYMELYMKSEKDKTNPYFSPLMAKNLSNQPKTLIITAQYCPLRDEGEYYGQLLKNADNEVEIHRIEDGLHGYFSLSPRFKIVKNTYNIINEFLRR